MSWREFWNRDTPIYVNERHKAIHYRRIADDIIPLIPHPGAHVLDYGSGEALSADRIARACGHLYLCDSAPLVRTRIGERHAGAANITVLAPEELDRIPDRSLGLVVVNSVLQYLSPAERDAVLERIATKLHPEGRLVLADIIPRNAGALTDAAALLKLAATHGFLLAALRGLVRTFFSDYRRKRAQFGLAQYDEEEVSAFLDRAGYRLERHIANLGHNAARMAFIARLQDGRTLP